MKKLRAVAAFTLIELLVGAGVTSVVGGVIYVVATEGVVSFARNASINRAYTEARMAIDKISADIDTAGRTPELVDATGTTYTPTTAQPSSQGVRFYRYANLPTYQIPSGTTADSSLTVNFTPYQKGGIAAQDMIGVGDLATIPLVGFQDTIASITKVVTNADGSGSLTLNFAKALSTNCVPALATDTSGKTVQTSFVPVAANTSATPPVPATYYTCLIFRQVAYIAVPNVDAKGVPTGGAKLRYYPRAMSTGVSTVPGNQACGAVAAFNNATVFDAPASYSVIANLYGGTITVPTGTAAVSPLLPFQILNNAAVNTTLCEEGPDYNNRSSAVSNKIGVANTFSLMRCTTAPRCAQLLH